MTAPTDVIARLATIERQGWTHDSPVNGPAPVGGQAATWRVCPAITAPNLNTAGGPSPRPPQNPSPPGPLHVDTLPARLTHAGGQWWAAGRFTRPASLDPALAALLDRETDYLLALDGHDVVVTVDTFPGAGNIAGA